MVDTKLNTGSLRKKHLMENKQEKTKKIVEKVKQEQSADGPPAKKVKQQKKPAEKKEGNAKVQNGNGAVEGERIKAKRIKHKKKAQKDKPVKNAERTEERETQFQKDSEEYLDKWKNDRTTWRFSKNLQTWLISNMLNDDKVSIIKIHSWDHFYLRKAAACKISRLCRCVCVFVELTFIVIK
jgi:hypothetical protein